MRPKEFFSNQTIQEDKKQVFCIFPQERAEIYYDHVREALELLKNDIDGLMYVCNLDFSEGRKFLPEIYHYIQQSHILIIDISNFDPTLQFILGVATTRKDKVILVCDEEFYARSENVLSFSMRELELSLYKFGDKVRIKNLIDKEFRNLWDGPDGPKIRNPRAIGLMEDAQKLISGESYDAAIALFREIIEHEPQSWYVMLRWAITYNLGGRIDEAKAKYDEALRLAIGNRNKAEVHLEKGLFFEQNRMEDEAIKQFEFAETLDSNNSELFFHWALLLEKLARNQDAMTKAIRAHNLKSSEKHKTLLQFITQKNIDPHSSLSFIEYTREKKWRTRGADQLEFTNKVEKPRNDFDQFWEHYRVHDVLRGKIKRRTAQGDGLVIELKPRINGVIKDKRLPVDFDLDPKFKNGNPITVRLIGHNKKKKQIFLDYEKRNY